MREFGRGLRLGLVQNADRLPNVSPPDHGIDLNLGIEKRLPGQLPGGVLKAHPQALLATRVLADRRKLPFSRIIVDVPEQYGPGEKSDDNDGEKRGDRKPRGVIGRGTKIDRINRPRRGGRPYVFSTGSLFSNFPGLDGVRVEVKAERTVPRSAQRRQNPLPNREEEKLSTLPPIGNGSGRPLQFNKTVPPGTRKELVPPREIRPCFLSANVAPARRVVVNFDELDRKLGSFSEAANILDRWDALDFAMSSGPRSRPTIVHAFEWTKEHGIWGWSVKHGRSRRILVHTLLLGDATVLAAEIERLKRGDTYSIGLIWPFEPVRSVDQIARIVGQLGVRNSGLHDPGTWPPHTFEDVRFASLYHSESRDVPNVLADEIMKRAFELLASMPDR